MYKMCLSNEFYKKWTQLKSLVNSSFLTPYFEYCWSLLSLPDIHSDHNFISWIVLGSRDLSQQNYLCIEKVYCISIKIWKKFNFKFVIIIEQCLDSIQVGSVIHSFCLHNRLVFFFFFEWEKIFKCLFKFENLETLLSSVSSS